MQANIAVYGIDGKLDASFPKNIQTTLRELAALAVELNSSPDLKLDNSAPVSRVSATLNLCYHQVRFEIHNVAFGYLGLQEARSRLNQF